ncbi:hypothetical protein FEZ51_01895 [Pediococcus stilesii]|uniref:Uncharacterized protein n=1 Tax=Pediococcus stilesii TaxID=331679 RepID=A0A5R9BXJ2_9LACO|nr:hypothetical protein [Pediococcus stilesii]TLQ05436.1 hypothetical protein FEZ51_01895 [Pediococcus stilesii]
MVFNPNDSTPDTEFITHTDFLKRLQNDLGGDVSQYADVPTPFDEENYQEVLNMAKRASNLVDNEWAAKQVIQRAMDEYNQENPDHQVTEKDMLGFIQKMVKDWHKD